MTLMNQVLIIGGTRQNQLPDLHPFGRGNFETLHMGGRRWGKTLTKGSTSSAILVLFHGLRRDRQYQMLHTYNEKEDNTLSGWLCNYIYKTVGT